MNSRGGLWTIFTPVKSFDRVIKEDGYPVLSKQLAQKIGHIRETKNHKTYIRCCLGLDNKTFGNIPQCYIHFLDKDLVDYKVSHKCCDYIKGRVKHDRRPAFVGTTIEESRLRKNSWIQHGCNIFDKKKPMCRPLSLWTSKDIWDYIDKYKIKYSPIYDEGYERSGCITCMFGMSLEKILGNKDPTYLNRFELLYKNNKDLFNSIVLDKKIGLWKPLTDMGIKLKINNKKYINLYNNRKKEIDEWYKNFDKNFKKIINEIQTRNPNVFTKKEINFLLKKYSKKINKGEKYE